MKSGFISIIGRPNVGKSTILNSILNKKISIVTNKSQTTRNNILGIYNKENLQIVFTDTPGIHKPRQKLSEEMNKMAFSSAHDVDAIMLVVDVSLPFGEGDQFLIDHVDFNNKPLIIVLNKIDKAYFDAAMEIKNKYLSVFPEAKIIECVATEKFNIDEIIKTIEGILPEGPAYYPIDVMTDKDQIFQIKEILREKILLTLKDEVPHCVAIYINNIEWENNPIHINANIIVEKDGQKKILIGREGKVLKSIGKQARLSIEKFLGKHVFLELFVKVEKGWRNEEKMLKTYGYIHEKK